MQNVHQPESKEGQEEYDGIVDECPITSDEIEMRIHPPGFVPDEVEEEGPEPHPKRVNGHEEEGLEYFDKVNVETIIDGNFKEHENDGQDVDGNIEKNGHWTEFNSAFEGLLLDCRIQNSPVDEHDNDVKYEASRVKKLQEPQIPRRCAISLPSKVTRRETGQSEGVPGVQGKISEQKKCADISEKEEELHGSLMGSVLKPENESHGQINCTEQPKEK